VGEFGAGADAELAVDARQVGLHGAGAHEQRPGDLLVGASGGGQLGDLGLGRGDGGRGGRAQADAAKLGLGPLGPQGGAELLKGCQGLLEGGRGGGFLAVAAQDDAVGVQGAGQLEREAQPLVLGERVLEVADGLGGLAARGGEQRAAVASAQARSWARPWASSSSSSASAWSSWPRAMSASASLGSTG
jgi:hypothetical protein